MKRNLPILILSVIISSLTAYGVVKISATQTVSIKGENSVPPVYKVNLSDQLYPDFTFAAENAVSSVVHVQVTKKGTERAYSIFDFFFGYGGQMPAPKQSSTGSGVIIKPDGYIVTNNHVIEGADEISVTLYNKKSYTAKLLGSDPVTDIALIKIEAENLPYLTFGDSDALRLGEWVLAIGNPYNLTSTITAGIVSAKARSIAGDVSWSPDRLFGDGQNIEPEFKIESFIQTDAAVNPGNSGGALVNTRGELIGINTAIASRTGSFAGYSFAVPSSIAKKVVEDIIDFGSVQRALLGIAMKDITGELAKEKKLTDTRGVYIDEVSKGGAADKAGIKSSDILVAINGNKVDSSPSVQEQINKFRPGDKIRVGVIREGKEKEFSVVLEKRSQSISELKSAGGDQINLFGAQIRKATEETLKKYELKQGLEVVKVEEGKFKSAGIRPGFVITHVNQYPVSDPSDILNVIERSRRSLFIEGQYGDKTIVYYGIGL